MRYLAINILLFLLISNTYAGEIRLERVVEWNTTFNYASVHENAGMLPFNGAFYQKETGTLPLYGETVRIPDGDYATGVWIVNLVYDIAPDGYGFMADGPAISEEPVLSFRNAFESKRPAVVYQFIPFRRNPLNQQLERVVSFEVVVKTESIDGSRSLNSGAYADESVLANGNWYKFSVTNTGVHRITYSDLQAMGINPASIDPRNIRIYGNGGGILSESLSDFRHDDLAENAIEVTGEADGRFDSQDFILFYGEAPHSWAFYDFSQAFNHEQNIYSDYTYYFLTVDSGPGKRVVVQAQQGLTPNVVVNRFTDYAFHEKDLFNLVNTGREWYGEVFDVNTTYDFNFRFPNIVTSEPVYLRAYVAAKSTSSSSFRFQHNGTEIMSAVISGIPSSSDTYARAFIGSDYFTAASQDVGIRITYQKPNASSLGWLNYIELNAIRQLIFTGGQMSFRDPSSAVPGTVARFTLGSAGSGVRIWNVTDPTQVYQVMATPDGNGLGFTILHETLQEFISFDGSQYNSVTFVEKVANQNLHGTGPRDMIIISHPDFMEQAQRLAGFHSDHSGLSVLVADINQVYNEFSSGAQDITAIRDFMKMLYDRAAPGEEPKYLLLFGDASFDYKDRIEGNSNYVPTWEDDESLTIVFSIATDDYYGFLDGPGDNLLDIGIGRLPVETPEQAQIAVDKIIHYSTNTEEVMKDWRNYICFVADDEDANLHVNQAEEMSIFLDTTYGSYNMDKIYIDAFPQVSTPGGQRAPEVNLAINNRIDKGCLVMNYTGHGGEVGWGHERFLENSDINSWTNYDRMPIFITATCEFSRYDDPERVSAGEQVYRNPNGGAIAMFTTARATFGGSNFNLNTALFEVMFEKTEDGVYQRFGDLIRIAKNKGGVVDNDKKFILLGDPALMLAYPTYEVTTTRINGETITSSPDTLRALAQITVEGEVKLNGNPAPDFNGTLFSTVFDKPSRVTTLDTDPSSQPKTFDLQNNVLYKGKAQVTDGKFSFTFIVPKDILYQYGFGKISYYAYSGDTDANGFYRNIVVGGFNNSAEPDLTGPAVRLYMNDENFLSGGITDESPVMLAFVEDESGINTIGSGIGHDIVAILDEDSDKPIILNDFYEADIDSYTSGTIRFPFHSLEEGRHTLSLKVWDVFNNSATAVVEFVVESSGSFVIESVSNYPNPVKDGTTFVFTHNRPGVAMDIDLDIYNLTGQVVRSFRETMTPAGYRTEPVYWNADGQGGYPVSKGVYFYRMQVRDESGEVATGDGKLIVIK